MVRQGHDFLANQFILKTLSLKDMPFPHKHLQFHVPSSELLFRQKVYLYTALTKNVKKREKDCPCGIVLLCQKYSVRIHILNTLHRG